MRASEIRQMSVADILAKVEETRTELQRLRMAWEANSLDNPNEIRKVRKTMARLLTVLREYEIAQEVVKGETSNG
jgi:large subunit ribosomal protein L29